MKNKILITFILFISTNAFTDEYLSIPLTQSSDSVAYVSEGTSIWYPIFFCLDEKGNVHIPDFYNGRITVFSSEGKTISQTGTGYISPRMNYFSMNSFGEYIVIDAGKLYLINSDGSLKWSFQFSFGFFPDAVYIIEQYIYVLFSINTEDQNGKGVYVFDKDTDQALGILAKEINSEILPVVVLDESSAVSDTVEHTFELNEETPKEGFINAGFFGSDRDKNTYWYERKMSAVYLNLEKNETSDPVAYIPSNYVWMFITDNGDIYYSLKELGDYPRIKIYSAIKTN